MSNRYYVSFINAAYVGAKSPTAPTTVTATKGNTSGIVSFSGATSEYGAITGYRVESTPGGFTATGASSPITVTGLTNDTSYTFQVTTINAFGESPGSVASNAIIPNPYGQEVFSLTYTAAFTWIVPIGTYSCSVLCVGAGGAGGYVDYYAGGGGGLRYKNNISVTPGQAININVCGQTGGGSSTTDVTFGTNGTDAFYFYAGSGRSGRQSPNNGAGGTGTTIGAGADGGGNGGNSTGYNNSFGGGGAGGYSGNGGDAGINGNGQAGSGGGGGGGYGYNSSAGFFVNYLGSGGGVGLLGEGASGTGGYGTSPSANEPSKSGTGGSGGGTPVNLTTAPGGQYGGGGGGSYVYNANGQPGAEGAVRIIWPATGAPISPRAFPSTNVGNL